MTAALYGLTQMIKAMPLLMMGLVAILGVRLIGNMWVRKVRCSFLSKLGYVEQIK